MLMKFTLVYQGNTDFIEEKNLAFLTLALFHLIGCFFLAVITYWRYAIFFELCYLLWHIPRSSAILFLNAMLQYITLTPSYANSSYAMFSGQSRGRISGYCCNKNFMHLSKFAIWQNRSQTHLTLSGYLTENTTL